LGIFETHAHYEDPSYDGDRDELLSRMNDSGIEFILNAGADPEDLPKAISIAEKYGFVYLSVGAHPHYAPKMTEEYMALFTKTAKHEKVVAIGEIGLDYHYDGHCPNTQKYWFLRQLELADRLSLPIIVHCRDADADMLEILSSKCAYPNCNADVTPLLSARPTMRGVLHCFSQSLEMARKYIEMGFFIGIGGVVTYKNAKTLTEVAEGIPLERILLETDCPYLPPLPYRGKRNESIHIISAAERLAGWFGVSVNHVAEATTRNAREFFGV
jgi:TatD DNase family protein